MKLFDNSLIAEEKKLERDSVDKGVARYNRLVKQATKRGEGASLKSGERLLVYWFEIYRKAIVKERQACEEHRAGRWRGTYGARMRSLDPSETAVIAMHTTLGMCLEADMGFHTTKVLNAIGRNLCAHMARKRFKRSDRDSWTALMHTDKKQIRPKGVLKVARQFFPEEIWPIREQAKLGATLLKMLIDVATVQGHDGNHHPAFDMYSVRRGRRTWYYLRLTPEAHETIRDAHLRRQILRPNFQPMVVQPLAWTMDRPGGYIEHGTPPVKRSHIHTTVTPQSIVNEAILDALNVLGATKWRINKRVLRIAQGLRDQGGNVAGIPRMSEIPMPPVPADVDTNEEVKKQWKREAVRVRERNVQLKAERVIAWHKFDIAERFKDYIRVYFPHDLDFRGRAYAIPLFLNHQGDDFCRGLLEYADGKAVDGKASQRWLQVHLANSCGVDKLSYDDRCQWVADGMGQFKRWIADTDDSWMAQEKPFQALAAAFALFDDEAAAHLPIQIDGSNNALQHYGAMLRCPETANLVNLQPGDKPADVYADVAALTQSLVAADAAKGDTRALKLEGWVTRKVVKQTVMTSVYGVTAVGARKQIHEWLVKAGFVDDALYEITKYLSAVVRKAVSQVCIAVHQSMTWLAACGRIIAKAGYPIRWTTPVGMRVEQSYRNARKFQIRTILHTLLLHETTDDCPVHVMRQVNGFAPNFIHSLDATHLMMTAHLTWTECPTSPMSFAGVHDSFWSHAADMDTLSHLLRKSFVELHKEPLLRDLYWQIVSEYPTLRFPEPPATGSFDIRQVLDSEYFFS